MRTVMFVVGGTCAGAGVMTGVLGGFGMPNGQPTATQISSLGYDGIDQLTIHPAGYAALALVFIGIALLVAANSTAYKETEGY